MDLPSDPVPSVQASSYVYNDIFGTEDDELWENDFRHILGKSCVKRITDSGERVPVTRPFEAGRYEITGPDGDVTCIATAFPMTGPEVLSTPERSSRKKHTGGKEETSTCSVDVAEAKKNP